MTCDEFDQLPQKVRQALSESKCIFSRCIEPQNISISKMIDVFGENNTIERIQKADKLFAHYLNNNIKVIISPAESMAVYNALFGSGFTITYT